jgi:hypothetical protein
MTEPTISIALCSHNGAAYIEEQLLTILAQTRRPTQLVLSDDASTDDTVAIARRVMSSPAAAGIRFSLLRNSVALGVVANFEGAVRACDCELVALCDQDDSWHPDRIAVAAERFAREPGLDLLFGDADLVSATGDPLGHGLFETLEVGAGQLDAIDGGQAFTVFIRRNIATGATVMFRKRLLESALPFPPDWVHDGWLATLAATLDSVGVTRERLIGYRQHGSNEIGVAYPTLSRKIRRTLMPRGERNARLARAFGQLATRVDGMPEVHVERRSVIGRKAAFEDAREQLPAARLRRIGPISRLARQGAYRELASQGALDMLRDLLQPHT